MAVYYMSLCKLTNTDAAMAECRSLLNGKLRGGYFVYSKLMVGVDNNKAQDLRIANEKYVIPALIDVLTSW